jgi:hypothetical protein
VLSIFEKHISENSKNLKLNTYKYSKGMVEDSDVAF